MQVVIWVSGVWICKSVHFILSACQWVCVGLLESLLHSCCPYNPSFRNWVEGFNRVKIQCIDLICLCICILVFGVFGGEHRSMGGGRWVQSKMRLNEDKERQGEESEYKSRWRLLPCWLWSGACLVWDFGKRKYLRGKGRGKRGKNRRMDKCGQIKFGAAPVKIRAMGK